MIGSEAPLPTNPPLQKHAPIRRRDPRPRRPLGLLPLLVLPEPLRPAIRLHFHPRKRQCSESNGATNAADESQWCRGMFQPGQDPDKLFKSEAENLEVVEHEYTLKGVEERVLGLA